MKKRKLTRPSAEEDIAINLQAASDSDNPEWTGNDFDKAEPITELHRKSRGKQKGPTKIPVSIRLDSVVVDHYKAKGRGWQSQLNEDLKSIINK
jgi:uncharacterized protein (DUF4415 family)